MLRMRRLILPAIAMLSSCGSADTGRYDPTSDLHCHALSTYFTLNELKKIGSGTSPGIGSVGIFATGEWYRSRFAKEQQRVGESEAAKERQALLKAIGDDFEASKRAYVACAERAAADPAFDAFTRAMLTEMKTGEFWTKPRSLLLP